MIRTVLFLNALIALLSCTGLGMNFVAVFKTPISQFKEYNLQCWTWLGTFIVSILLTTVIVIQLVYFRQSKHTRVSSSSSSLIGFIVNLVTCIIFVDKTSWDDRAPSVGGLFLHCGVYDNNNDPSYPLFYQRCLLTDATWISGLLLCFLWLTLFCVVWYSPLQHNTQIHKYQLSETLPSTGPCKRIEHFSYLPTKALPPFQQPRPSDDNTLFLPIHSNTTTATTCRGIDNVLQQSHDEKVQVSDLWLQNFDASIVVDGSCSSKNNSTYAHSMDLGWMKRIHNRDGIPPMTGSRRMVMAQSCPEFNKKRVKTLLTRLPSGSDGASLHY
ncbi:hypothetical protein BC941DRAFT_506749 [Chlamydoabsidia padenii]|nr:hypothetical protein BC941DRAFT_506749 [Chlamydoabsidia padenii]